MGVEARFIEQGMEWENGYMNSTKDMRREELLSSETLYISR